MSILRIFFTLALQLACLGVFPLSATSNLYDKVDDLTLSYDGNRLADISQGSDADDFYDYTPYGDPSATSGQCTYDQNGNMTSNRRKGIASVTYNLLNLPNAIWFTDGSTISYAYDMTGEKRRVEYSTAATTMEQPVAASLQSEGGTAAQIQSGSGSVTTTVDYFGSLIFQNGIRYIRLEDDGIWDGLHGGYCFYVKDHLGNVRSVNNLNGASIQTSKYYPFGKIWDDYIWNGSTQPFRFGGKELDKMHGLEWYDFGARMYDPGIGRFMTMDSKAGLKPWQSPYVYGRNNPLRYIDPDGNEDEDIFTGYFIGTVTNIFPFTSGMRDWYRPADASDYNAALQSVDNAFIAIGEGMTDAGKGGAAAGTAVAATGGMLVVGSGGSAVVVGGAAVAVGATLTVISSIASATGTLMQMNAANNKARKYISGGNESNVSSGNKNSQHASQKKKDISREKYYEVSKRYKSLKSQPNKTPELKKEIENAKKLRNKLFKQMNDPGENHSRNAKGNR